MGHQCTTSLPLAALGGFAGQFLNNGTAVYEMGPVNVAMERQIVRWMTGLAGWELDADGVFTSGGSIGDLAGPPRGAASRRPKRMSQVPGVGSEAPVAVLVPESCHYCVKRAVQSWDLVGGSRVSGDLDDLFHMRPDDLGAPLTRRSIAASRPITLVANACSTASRKL